MTTHCRYIDVTNVDFRKYSLRYFLHLPNRATLTQIEVHVADFAQISTLFVKLRFRPWDSRDAGTFLSSAATAPGIPGDTTLTIADLEVAIENHTNHIGLMFSPHHMTSLVNYAYMASRRPIPMMGAICH